MSEPRGDWIWHQGTWRPWSEATVHVTTHALHYGSSVYEGIRCYDHPEGPALFRLGDHVRRLRRSCRLLGMAPPVDDDTLAALCKTSIRRNRQRAAYVRPLVYRGAGPLGLHPGGNPAELTLFSFPWGRYLGPEALEAGVDVCVSSWRRIDGGSLMPHGKIGGQYVNNQLASAEAKRNGYADAVMLDRDGDVAEGAGQNLFVVADGRLMTPPTSAPILEGITRDTVLTLARDLGIATAEVTMPREALLLADEVFLTGTASEITPVRSIDRARVGGGRPGPITRALQTAFTDLTEGRRDDPHPWLTFVGPEPEATHPTEERAPRVTGENHAPTAG